MTEQLQPTRPYLLRAMHEWMSDNNQTPLIVVDASVKGCEIPEEHIQDDRIVLNISWSATQNLLIENETVTFAARFSGVSRPVTVPMEAVQGIYARESGQGMMFQDEPGMASAAPTNDSDGDDGDDNTPPPKNRGGLRVVK